MQTNLGPTHHELADILIDNIISEMVEYLMEDYGYTLEKALDAVYTSNTLTLLLQEEAELYVQSAAYVYDMLINELGLLPIGDEEIQSKVAED